MPLNAGDLNWPCRFYRADAQRLASGGITAPPSGQIGSVFWAGKREINPGENAVGGATYSTATIELKLRKDDRIYASNVVLVDSKFWELVGPPVDPDGLRDTMLVYARPCRTV